MAGIEVCLSTALFSNFDVQGKNVVVIDVLRATSAICAVFKAGASKVYATDDYQEALQFQKNGMLAAGESDGIKCEGFDFGNSPLLFGKTDLSGKEVAFYTTNGTRAIKMIPATANKIIIACMSNLSAVVKFLESEKKDTVILCAGWKGQPSVEDTLCAGAICEALLISDLIKLRNDSAVLSQLFLKQNQGNIKDLFVQSEHGQRLKKLGFSDDVEFCSLIDTSNVIPLNEDSYFCNKSHQ